MTVIPSTLSDRLFRLNRRERVFLGIGACALVVFLLYLLLPADVEKGVELADAPPAAAPPAATGTPLKLSEPAPAPVPPPAASTDGLTLLGIFGGGPRGGSAIILLPGGAQRVVPIGRQFLPGLTLKEVGLAHAIVSTASGDIRLGLNKAGGSAAPETMPARSGARADAPSLEAAATRRSRETLAFRMGLEKTRLGGDAAGYKLKSGGQVPILAQAGMQPGDILLSVNGQAISDDERLFGLSDEIAQEARAEIKFQRNGKIITNTVQIQGE